MPNVVVTGGSRGIGACIAGQLASSGFNIIAVARSISPTVQSTLSQQNIRTVEWDLSNTDTLRQLASAIRTEFGPIFGLVNNAGIGTAAVLTTMPEKAIEQLVRVNLLAPIMLTKYLVKSMLAERQGRVVNVSSIVANTGFPGLAVYSATKASLVGFTRSLAREVGPLNITVNAVAPGFIDTSLTAELSDKQQDQIRRRSALQRLATGQDVAKAVDFLMSDGARNMTGTVVTVDAGSTS
jgi:3-oxoacyl-[acyl-carrier protein] reductase